MKPIYGILATLALFFSMPALAEKLANKTIQTSVNDLGEKSDNQKNNSDEKIIIDPKAAKDIDGDSPLCFGNG
ncbi:MAG: hypothetical protein M9962_11170 [Oligoflexia bacterium]|nr:hypothetical protein [Oligoflexia bacterium]